jgi:hypothetical protein
MKYRSKTKNSTNVDVLGFAEFRLGETRRECVIYTRNGMFYVRTKAEFMAKFEPYKDAKT